MKKHILLLITSFLLVSCGQPEPVKTIENPPVILKQTVATGSITESSTGEIVGTASPELVTLLQNSPFKELYKAKKWKLSSLPEGMHWKFVTDKWATVEITYTGNPSLGGKSTLQINNISVVDTSDCLEWQKKAGEFSEDDPIFVRADCKKYYHGFEFNGKKVEHDFKNSIDGIFVSKTNSSIAIYWGKLVIDFEKGNYRVNENTADLEKNGFILLARVN